MAMGPGIGQYVPGASWLHRLDPRAKLVATFALAAALFVRQDWAPMAVFAGAALAGVLISRVPAMFFWRGLKPLMWLLVLTFVAQLFFAHGEPLAQLGPLRITREGLTTAGLLGVRLIVLVVTGLLLTVTTPPIPLTDGLAWLLRPLRALKVPTEELALMVTIALRFIPTLLDEVQTIMMAQRARGADFSRGGPVRRAKALIPVLVPLFVSSFRRADELALAMEARCFEPGQKRTRLHPLRAGPADVVLAVAVAGIIAVAMVL